MYFFPTVFWTKPFTPLFSSYNFYPNAFSVPIFPTKQFFYPIFCIKYFHRAVFPAPFSDLLPIFWLQLLHRYNFFFTCFSKLQFSHPNSLAATFSTTCFFSRFQDFAFYYFNFFSYNLVMGSIDIVSVH